MRYSAILVCTRTYKLKVGGKRKSNCIALDSERAARNCSVAKEVQNKAIALTLCLVYFDTMIKRWIGSELRLDGPQLHCDVCCLGQLSRTAVETNTAQSELPCRAQRATCESVRGVCACVRARVYLCVCVCVCGVVGDSR